MSGTFLVNSLPTHVLFDLGADHSFVSHSLCQRFTTPTTNLADVLVVEVASGELVVVHDQYDKCTIELYRETFVIDLLPISLRSFDVVICMDWLAANHAEILCSKKIIKVPSTNGGTIMIYGEKGNRLLPLYICLKHESA